MWVVRPRSVWVVKFISRGLAWTAPVGIPDLDRLASIGTIGTVRPKNTSETHL